MSEPSQTPAPSSPGEGSAGRRPRSAKLRGQDAHLSHRFSKANRLAAELRRRIESERVEQGKEPSREALEQADSGYRFSVMRAAGVNLNWRLSDETWRFSVGQAVQKKRRKLVG